MDTHGILIVDDNPEIRQLLRLTLEGPGVRLGEATTGMQALELMDRERPDLVILDVMMPGDVDGLAVCRRIRADARCASVRIVLLSARGQKADIEAGVAAGANAYVVKPFSPAALQTTVFNLLSGESP